MVSASPLVALKGSDEPTASSSKHDSALTFDEQWETCLEERRKDFETYEVEHKRKQRAIKEKTKNILHIGYRKNNIYLGTEGTTKNQCKK